MTKIYNPVMDDDSRPPSINDGPLVNQMGLSRKHIFEAIDRCLERLGTDYIGRFPLIMRPHVIYGSIFYTSTSLGCGAGA